MKKVIMAMSMAAALATSAVQAENKPLPADVGPGRVAWFDITTTNLQQAKDFYGKLFDWRFTAVKGTEHAAEIVASGTAIGTIRVADGKIAPWNGVVYIQVTDLPASCKKAKELGAVIPPGFPFNLPDGIGAIAVIADPAGHPVGLYSRTPLPATKPPASK